MISRCLFILLLSYSSLCQAQLMDAFDDGDLTGNPTWSGDIDKYAVVDGQCRLNATEAGFAFIYTEVSYPDSIQIDLYFEINTNPSANNFSRIYIALTDSDLTIANGLYLQLGEGGSDDAISLYSLEEGIASQLASATMGAIASRPEVAIQMVVDQSGLFSLNAAYDGSTSLVSEFETLVSFDFSTARYFGMFNQYTGSNITNFAYDNISIKPYIPDTEAPNLIGVEVVDATTLQLLFNENVLTTGISINDITVDNNASVIDITSSNAFATDITVTLDASLISGPTYTISISNLTDSEGNIQEESQSLPFFFAVSPSSGDLLINEILFNPIGPGSDYVEVISQSDKILQIKDMKIRNASNEQEELIESNIILRNNEIACFTENLEDLINNYSIRNLDNIYINNLPSFNNDNGNVSIAIDSMVIDSFDYDESFHFSLIDDVDGVSLERISLIGPTNDPKNWQSAATTVGYGTPGLPNSNLIQSNPGDELFTIEEPTFSPNQDGDKDVLSIAYRLDKPGFVATVRVYDNRGFEVVTLTNNELLGQSGAILWNGILEDGTLGRIGTYIIFAEAFHPDGDVVQFKKAVVLADFF